MIDLLSDLIAVAVLVPVVVVALRRGASEDRLFRGALAVAILGPGSRAVPVLAQAWQDGVWQTGLSATLWVSLTATLILYAGVTGLVRGAWRLVPLLVPYGGALGLVAAVWERVPGRSLAGGAPEGWVVFHILVAVLTYAALTVGAAAAGAAFLQERALKTKHPTRLSRLLPPVAESERLSGYLLVLSEVVLGLGLASGAALQYLETGEFLRLDHKTLLSLMTFAVIGGLLVARRVTGMRGRSAAGLVVLAYGLLTLAYPGVKFVTDILLRPPVT